MKKLLIPIVICIFIAFSSKVFAARDTNSFDGNIFPIYSGNGSLVPPASSLEQSINNNRTSVIVFYLDDSSTSKIFAPVVSGIKLVWSNSIDVIPLTIDEIQGSQSNDPKKESYYWHGKIPQTVVIDGTGKVIMDREGQVPIDDINQAISLATGIEAPNFKINIKSYNEYNSEASKQGYTDPR